MSTQNKIKLYGFGVVGQGFQHYLAQNEDAKRLHTIIVKDDTKKRKNVPSVIECTNDKTLRDKDVDVILELISSPEEAYGIVAENLEIGKKVISANKKLIAENLAELIKIERNHKGTFLYEGAVCGSIPIIRILNDLYANEPIEEIKGIFNGSSNYILSKIFSENISYEDALIQAQELGFAEADPTSDLGGFDSLYKLIILTAHAFGKVIQPKEVLNIGIDSLTKNDIEFAKNNHLKIKLVANVKLIKNELTLTVLPTLVTTDNDLFNVENEYNGVLIRSTNIGQQFYKGKGAGSLPTGSVVYADLKAIDNEYRYSYNKLKQQQFEFSNDEEITVILNANDSLAVKNLPVEIKNLFPLDLFGKQFIAKISIEELKENKYTIQKAGVSVIAVDDEKLADKIIQKSFIEETLIA